jgi:hypothetical protein
LKGVCVTWREGNQVKQLRVRYHKGAMVLVESGDNKSRRRNVVWERRDFMALSFFPPTSESRNLYVSLSQLLQIGR